MIDKRYIVSMAPHIKSGRTIPKMMLLTIAALALPTLWGCYQFGVGAVLIVVAGIAGAVATEALLNVIQKKPQTIGDLNAVLIGLVLALLIPAAAPWWVALVGAVMAILIGKAVFGPLGGAPISPALVGLLIVAISWPTEMTSYAHPNTAAEQFKAEGVAPAENPVNAIFIDASDAMDYQICELFMGKQVGSIGAISPMLLLLGGLFLILMRVARWQAPVGFLLGMGVAAGIANAMDPMGAAPAAFHLFTGMTFIGAFFLCTDFSSTPVTPMGMFLFGIIGGGLAFLFRISGMPFGAVPWAIVIMSLATPLFDRIAQAPFGKVVHNA